jgi:hypothetical protein
MLRHRLDKCVETYDARSLKLEEIDSKSSNIFFENLILKVQQETLLRLVLLMG